MTPENFVYWLQGFLEIGKPTVMNEEQVQEIKNHLALVLNKVTPYITVTGSIEHGIPNKNKDIFPICSSTPLIKLEQSGNETAQNAANVLKKYKNIKHVVTQGMPYKPYYGKRTDDNQFIEFPTRVNCCLKGHGTIPGIFANLLTKELEECYTIKLDKELGLKPVFSCVQQDSKDIVTVPVIIYKNDGWYEINEDEVQKRYVFPFWGWKEPDRYYANFGHYPQASC